jgi:hypothetical protein
VRELDVHARLLAGPDDRRDVREDERVALAPRPDVQAAGADALDAVEAVGIRPRLPLVDHPRRSPVHDPDDGPRHGVARFRVRGPAVERTALAEDEGRDVPAEAVDVPRGAVAGMGDAERMTSVGTDLEGDRSSLVRPTPRDHLRPFPHVPRVHVAGEQDDLGSRHRRSARVRHDDARDVVGKRRGAGLGLAAGIRGRSVRTSDGQDVVGRVPRRSILLRRLRRGRRP